MAGQLPITLYANPSFLSASGDSVGVIGVNNCLNTICLPAPRHFIRQVPHSFDVGPVDGQSSFCIRKCYPKELWALTATYNLTGPQLWHHSYFTRSDLATSETPLPWRPLVATLNISSVPNRRNQCSKFVLFPLRPDIHNYIAE